MDCDVRRATAYARMQSTAREPDWEQRRGKLEARGRSVRSRDDEAAWMKFAGYFILLMMIVLIVLSARLSYQLGLVGYHHGTDLVQYFVPMREEL